MNGIVFTIEEFSIYDGPGIRTTVFLKGCPLRCIWCHNPEGQEREKQIIKSTNGCIECGTCERFSRRENGRTVYTDESITHCPKKLLRVCGEEYTPERLCERLLKNERILSHGGGVTFSGGEPLMQSEFLCECLERIGTRLHTAVQTSGFCDSDTFSRVLSRSDMFLYDLKIMDDGLHRKYTGVSNKNILENYKSVAQSGKSFITRIPLIPTISDTEENIEKIADFMCENGVHYAELMQYNKMAGSKYSSVGREYSVPFDACLCSQPREEIFKAHGIEIKVI